MNKRLKALLNPIVWNSIEKRQLPCNKTGNDTIAKIHETDKIIGEKKNGKSTTGAFYKIIERDF